MTPGFELCSTYVRRMFDAWSRSVLDSIWVMYGYICSTTVLDGCNGVCPAYISHNSARGIMNEVYVMWLDSLLQQL